MYLGGSMCIWGGGGVIWGGGVECVFWGGEVVCVFGGQYVYFWRGGEVFEMRGPLRTTPDPAVDIIVHMHQISHQTQLLTL